jgi:hypothetical protein
MKVVSILIGAGICLLMLGGIMSAIKAARGSNFTEPHIIATGGGITQENITLAATVMDGLNTNVIVTSTNPLDAPIPFALNAITKQLTVTGLNASDTRTLTITYPISDLDGFTDEVVRFIPAFWIIGVLCCIGGAGYLAFRPDRD